MTTYKKQLLIKQFKRKRICPFNHIVSNAPYLRLILGQVRLSKGQKCFIRIRIGLRWYKKKNNNINTEETDYLLCTDRQTMPKWRKASFKRLCLFLFFSLFKLYDWNRVASLLSYWCDTYPKTSSFFPFYSPLDKIMVSLLS